jgi:hypothetical protein
LGCKGQAVAAALALQQSRGRCRRARRSVKPSPDAQERGCAAETSCAAAAEASRQAAAAPCGSSRGAEHPSRRCRRRHLRQGQLTGKKLSM